MTKTFAKAGRVVASVQTAEQAAVARRYLALAERTAQPGEKQIIKLRKALDWMETFIRLDEELSK